MNLTTLIQEIRRLDDERPSMPGEHWFTLAAAFYTLRHVGSARTSLGRLVALVAGGALLVRAASGRDGVIARLTSEADRPPTTPTPQ